MKELSVQISAELDFELTQMAVEAGVSRIDILRRGLAVMKGFRIAKLRGFRHIGFVTDPKKLDIEVVNVL